MKINCTASFSVIFFSSFFSLKFCYADCVSSGSNVICSGNIMTGYTATTSDLMASIVEGSVFSIARTPATTVNWAISVLSASQVTNSGTINLNGAGVSGNRGSALLATNDTNTLINAPSGNISVTGSYNNGLSANGNYNSLINHGNISTTGGFGYGMAAPWGQGTVGTQTNNTAINTGSITTRGSNARAISIGGGSSAVENSGTVITTGTSADAVYMQGNNISLINTGLIQAQGSGSNGVFSNTVSSSFTGTIINGMGGQIISQSGSAIKTLNGPTTITNAGLLQGLQGNAITGGNGNVSLILQTGSQISGHVAGGTGANTQNAVRLEGTGLLNNSFSNFQTLNMAGSYWTWQGVGDFQNTRIASGTLLLQTDYTGNVAIAAGANLSVAPGADIQISPSPLGVAPITVSNAGTIDVGPDLITTSGKLTVVGNYVGQNGVLHLNTTLNADASPSNQLIIANGAATGNTQIRISNSFGVGAVTSGDGILLVQALNGAITDDAFSLAAPVAAGPYEYLLFKGGVAGNAENWYLRSSNTSATLDVSDLPPPTPDASLDPGPVVIFYRPETAVYAGLEPVMKQATLAILGTFHERRGEQSVLTPKAPLASSWLRVFGESTRQAWLGEVAPRFKGSNVGVQGGLDFLSLESATKHRDVLGLMGGYNRTKGSVSGDVLGWLNYAAGRLQFDGWSFGAYWTHIAPNAWYVDAVLMNTWFDGWARSSRHVGIDVDKSSFLTSIESGYPVLLTSYSLTLEPQAQLIWQNLPTNRQKDSYSSFVFQADNSLTGRVGFRLQKDWTSKWGVSQPYLKTNFWKHFSNRNALFFVNQAIGTIFSEEALEVGGGVVHHFSDKMSAFALTGYTFDVQGAEQRTWSGQAGIRLCWH